MRRRFASAELRIRPARAQWRAYISSQIMGGTSYEAFALLRGGEPAVPILSFSS
jgi:hypothetical protein